MARVLIIGGSGYIGKHLLALLKNYGSEVWSTFLKHPEFMQPHSKPLDVKHPEEVGKLLRELAPQVIFHLACDMGDLEGSVVQGTKNLLDAWAGLGRKGRLFYISTDMVFDGEHPPYREEDPPEPLTPYGEAKLKAEAAALEAGAHVLRISLVYGLNPPDPRTESLKKGLRTGTFDYPYFEDEMRSAVFVEDLCLAMVQLALIEKSIPPVLHIAGPESLSRYSLACLLAIAMGFDPGAVPKAALAQSGVTRPRDLTLGVSLVSKILGWSPRSVREVLQGTGALMS